MNTKHLTNRGLRRALVNLVSILVVLALVFPVTGSVTAQEPSLYIRAHPVWDSVDAWFWPQDATLHLSIDDPNTEGSPDLEMDMPGEVDPNIGSVWFEFAGVYDLKPGDLVTITDGVTTRSLIVSILSIEAVDVQLETVSGVVEPGTEVRLPISNNELFVTGDSEGYWFADFTQIGFDLTPGTMVIAEVFDEDGDNSSFEWYISNPHFTVFPEWEWFDGLDWPDGAIVSIGVEGISECSLERESWGGFFNGNFGEGCDLVVGDEVTFTDGETTRTHTVQNLAITKVNQEDDTIKGVASAGAEVHVWPHATGQEQVVIANPQGKWDVDFTGIYDLMTGDDGRAEIRDELGNATAVDWYIPKSRIVASITEDWFYLQEFSSNEILDFTVYEAQGEKPIWKGTATTDGSGFAWIDAEDRWNLEPGNYLLVRDGQNTKDLIIEGFTFDVFDLSQGLLQGTVPGEEGRHVWAGIGFENDGWSMDVFTDADGNWVADFGQPVPADYWWVAAQIFDDDGDASELRPERIVDLWVAAFTSDVMTWSEGNHSYFIEGSFSIPEPGGGETSDPIYFTVSSDAPWYDGNVLLRFLALRARVGDECPAIDPVIRPDQNTLFHYGWVTGPMTYQEAAAHFDTLTVTANWDTGMSTELVRHEIFPWSSVDWNQYLCSATAP